MKSSGSYATVTAWAKGTNGWKSVLSTTAGRVGSNGVVDGATRRQNTYTTPSGTYTLTEGFGVEAGSTNMPYTRLNSNHWWVEDPESAYYNSMHSATGADFPLTESGDRGSEHLIDHPTQYAKALVINFNRWPATPGRGAGIFLHVNGAGSTAGCVSVPRATMDRIMGGFSRGRRTLGSPSADPTTRGGRRAAEPGRRPERRQERTPCRRWWTSVSRSRPPATSGELEESAGQRPFSAGSRIATHST